MTEKTVGQRIWSEQNRIQENFIDYTGRARSTATTIKDAEERTGQNIAQMIAGSGLAAGSYLFWRRWGAARQKCMQQTFRFCDDFAKGAKTVPGFNQEILDNLAKKSQEIMDHEARYLATRSKQDYQRMMNAREEFTNYVRTDAIPEFQSKAFQGMDEGTRKLVEHLAPASDDVARMTAIRELAAGTDDVAAAAKAILAETDDLIVKQANAMKEAIARRPMSGTQKAALNQYFDDIIKDPSKFNPAQVKELAGRNFNGQLASACDELTNSLGKITGNLTSQYQQFSHIAEAHRAATNLQALDDVVKGIGYPKTAGILSQDMAAATKIVQNGDELLAKAATGESNLVRAATKLPKNSLSKLFAFGRKACGRALPILGTVGGIAWAVAAAKDEYSSLNLDNEEDMQKLLDQLEQIKVDGLGDMHEDTYKKEQKQALIDWAIENSQGDERTLKLLNGIKDADYDYAQYLRNSGAFTIEHSEHEEWDDVMDKMLCETANANFYTMLDQLQEDCSNNNENENDDQGNGNGHGDDNGNGNGDGNGNGNGNGNGHGDDNGNGHGDDNGNGNGDGNGHGDDNGNGHGDDNGNGNGDDNGNGNGNGNGDDNGNGNGNGASQTLRRHGQPVNLEGLKFTPTKIRIDDVINSL